jgi:hypothetical protein
MKAAILLGVIVLIAGVWWWYRVSSLASPPGVTATVDVPGDYSICTVGLDESRQAVPCSNVGSYMRDAMKLSSDTGVLIRPGSHYSGDSIHSMTEQVHAAGYLIVPYTGGIAPEVSRGDR